MPYHIEPKDGQFLVVDDSGKTVGTHSTRQQAIDQQRALYANVEDATKATAEINDLPDSAFLHVESGGTKDDTDKTVPRSLRHLPYKTDSGAVDLPKLRNALSRLGQTDTGTTGGDKWLTASLRDSLRAKAEKILADENDKTNKEARPSLVDRVVSFLKEGRRNSSGDAERLQQIHDLSVENGATCPMVFKQANGVSRWVLFSTNSYQDRDGEIITQAAQEADTERMTVTKEYGPLRLWHLGYPDTTLKNAGPGIDIGDCDYSQMVGRVRVESGTFRDERIAAAIKGRADQWVGSVGFFHPLDQPDRDGLYSDSYTFERSLLPRGKQSNYFAPLAAIVKENSMTTKEDKINQLAGLLGDAALADAVLKQAEATEKAAQERGLKYKETDKPETKEAAPATVAVPAHGSGGLMSAFGLEPDDDEATCKEKIGKVIGGVVKSYMESAAKETATKEAGLTAQITALEKSVKELIGEQPRGFMQGFRPSQSEATILKGVTFQSKETGDPLDSVISQLMGVKPQ